ncbi:hypothetical protein [Enhygromyxa salina]|uniref:Uncharacterized protein n=1 Tax=Enhygromyxa salina TaxID=215803 RepID=A0A2S9YPS0_9BACT|nr:hypothetical protein [Enhygromyxa salina]PRQ07094.1 hypothetical protein ENSA7_32330 [Enhygromyxa salina]
MADPTHDPPATRRVLPARALLSPAWLLALAVLITNDHWLKGADVIPAWLTGKLSDFAGMLVAPVLLAALLRVRTRGALAACHVAVGLVFAAIQLSPACAGLWSGLMGLVGFPWVITCDPTDLLALPLLGLSWQLLVPHMDPERSPLRPLQRSAVAGLCALGLWSSVATTEGDGWDDEGDGGWDGNFENVYGHVYLNNTNDTQLALHIRYRRGGVTLDCDAVAQDPGRLLTAAAFGEAEHWLLPARANVGVELDGPGCDAAWIAGESIDPVILFIDHGANKYIPRWYPGQIGTQDELHTEGLGVQFEPGERAQWIGGDDIRFTPRTDAPEQPASCEAPATESRIEWSVEVPELPAELLSVEAGLDGCFELELREVDLVDQELTPAGDPYFWYVCAPPQAMPFVVGDFISAEAKTGAQGTRELTLVLLDAGDLQPARDVNGVWLLDVRLLRGGNDPAFVGPAVGRELEALPAPSCPWQLHAGCATAERHVQLRVVGAQNPVQPGVPVSFSDPAGPGARVHTMIVSYTRERAVVDSGCADGATTLSHDIDVAVIDEPLL